jgi:hypothetical protein
VLRREVEQRGPGGLGCQPAVGGGEEEVRGRRIGGGDAAALEELGELRHRAVRGLGRRHVASGDVEQRVEVLLGDGSFGRHGGVPRSVLTGLT